MWHEPRFQGSSNTLTHFDDFGREVALVAESVGGGEGRHEHRKELLLGGEEAGDGAESGHCDWWIEHTHTHTNTGM